MSDSQVETVGIYDVVEYFNSESGAPMIRLKCRECGTIKVIRRGNRRHTEKTKFCRSCPPRVRRKVYEETWNTKNKGDPERMRLLTEEELETREKWSSVHNLFKPASST